jgi:hypothetical protein
MSVSDSRKLSKDFVERVKTILGVEQLPLSWSEKEISEYKIRSLSSLQRDRVVGGGIPFLKCGKGRKSQVKYLVSDVLLWMQENTVTSTAGY